MQPLRLVCDANIPAAEAAFGPLGSVRLLPGRAITNAEVQGADVLLVRSVTRVDAALLRGTSVRFVGTATAGTDHVDVAALADLGVAFASAPGSNATSVVEYVLAALLEVAESTGFDLTGATLGVVGAGAVGGRLVPRARALGLDVLVCDPPRADAGHTDHAYRPLADVLAASDIVTLHTPLTDSGLYPTRGLIGADALAAMRAGAILVNAARGPVADGPALIAAHPRLGALVLDCWPGEPEPDPDLVSVVDIATPHIAGYSAEGKLRGTAVLARALHDWLGRTDVPWTVPPSPDRVIDVAHLPTPSDPTAWLARVARQAYDVWADDARFRAAMAASDRAAAFSELRRTYPTRNENAAFVVRGDVPAGLRRAVTDGLGMRIASPSP